MLLLYKNSKINIRVRKKETENGKRQAHESADPSVQIPDCSAIEDVVRRAGAILKEAHLSNDAVMHKEGDANFVTSYDVAVQKFLIEELHRILPEADFFGAGGNKGKYPRQRRRWVLFLY